MIGLFFAVVHLAILGADAINLVVLLQILPRAVEDWVDVKPALFWSPSQLAKPESYLFQHPIVYVVLSLKDDDSTLRDCPGVSVLVLHIVFD